MEGFGKLMGHYLVKLGWMAFIGMGVVTIATGIKIVNDDDF